MVLGISNCHLKDIVKMSRDIDLCNIVDYPLISTLSMMNLPAAAVCTITAPSHDVSAKIYSDLTKKESLVVVFVTAAHFGV